MFFGHYIFQQSLIFNLDNCSLTFFSVADVFALSVRFTGTDVVTKHELNLSVINDFSFNRSSTIFCGWIG